MNEILKSKQPLVFKASFEAPSIQGIIHNLGHINPEHPLIEALHVYKNRLQRPDLKDTFLRHMHSSRQGFWNSFKAFDDTDGLLVSCSQVETLTPDLKHHLAAIIRLKLRVSDIPLAGFQVSLDIGANACVAERRDVDEAVTFYFHLGPDPRIVSLIEAKTHLERKLRIESGDTLVIPARYKRHHDITGSSAGIEVSYRRLTRSFLRNQVFAQLFQDICKNQNDSLNTPLEWFKDGQAITTFDEIIPYTTQREPASAPEIFDAFQDFMFGQISRGGWRSDRSQSTKTFSGTTKIRINPIVTIIIRRDHQKVNVYAGSKKLRLNQNPGLWTLTKNLKSKPFLMIDDAISHLTPCWSRATSKQFLEALGIAGGIEFF